MTAPQYKERVGLLKSSALVSETYRAKLIKQGLDSRLKNLRPNPSHSPETRAKISAALKELRAEKQNLTNTCPAQLLERLVSKYNELGYTPPSKSIGFKDALIRVYGSYENACKEAGIPYRKPGYGRTAALKVKWTRDRLIETVARFHQENGRLPNSKEYKPYYVALKKYGKKEIFKLALKNDGVYKKVDFVVRYDKETLLNFLRIFERNNGRRPSYSDCKRGLLPHLSRYSYNFGSWKNALTEAFPPQV